MTFEITDNAFRLNGKEIFLNSGEIQYFRIKKEYWHKHLAAAKEAGLVAVATYIPWDWHEPRQGMFDFTGETHPQRDVIGWIKACHAHGLKCIVKPGPFILAEYRGAGLPSWFVAAHADECLWRTREGEPVVGEPMSFLHPTYLKHVAGWYDQIMPLIAEHHVSQGGPIIMMQICNEVGVFQWLAHRADYNTPAPERFIQFVEEKYNCIDALNRVWGTSYNHFSDVEMPPEWDVPYAGLPDRARDLDWGLFWRRYFGDYLRLLIGMARERGVDMPFYHNLPGWIFGSGWEFPVNITMYNDLYDGADAQLIFGVDHIPEYLSHRNMHDDRIINDIVLAMQERGPLFAAEFQSGSREYHVVTNPRELELFYKASLANGLRGWNYYMFSQGRNMPAKGFSGDTFYWYTPLTAEGEKTSAYPLIQKTSRLINTLEPILLSAERKADVCVLFDPAHYATEIARPVGDARLDIEPVEVRRPAYFDGLLRVLQILNIDYDMLDISRCTLEQISAYKQVWCFSTDVMSAANQQQLADYTQSGGQLVLFPTIPHMDESLQPCTVLREWLGVGETIKQSVVSPLIELLGQADVKCANPQIVFHTDELTDAEVIAHTLDGAPCGFEKRRGHGNVLVLGTWLGYDTEGHLTAYENLLSRADAKLRQATATHKRLAVRQRFTPDGRAMLFAGNYFNEPCTGRISYTHPASGETISIPYDRSAIEWPALYAIVTPINMPISNELTLLHSTSDIHKIDVDEDVMIVACGDRDLPGELALEGPVERVTVDGVPTSFQRDGSRAIVRYPHKRDADTVIVVIMR